jgi:hypothetical protein
MVWGAHQFAWLFRPLSVTGSKTTFEDVARILASPKPPPPWLARHLEWWAARLKADRLFDSIKPLKGTQNNELLRLEELTLQILRSLGLFRSWEYLNIPPLLGTNDVAQLEQRLRDLAENVASVKRRTKPGERSAGRPTLLAKTRCATRIAETWKFLHHEYPAPRNQQAAEAAQAYWVASGGSLSGWGDNSLGAWRYHFQKAMGQECPVGAKLRAIWRRDLAQNAHRGRPPWFLPANYSS